MKPLAAPMIGLILFSAPAALRGAATASGVVEPVPAASRAGALEAKVAVVTSDFSVKPVPKQKFVIVAREAPQESPGDAGPIAVVTGFDGVVRQSLSPGLYRIRSETPVDVGGKRLSWDVPFEIRTGATTTVELSNDNASIELAPAARATSRDLDAGALYERYQKGVVKIIADGGHGSGFLVSDTGLIVTNHHVIADATYLAAKLDDPHKHQVAVIAEDPAHDVAILRIHPDTIRGRPVLPLADDGPDGALVAVGDRVVAIGSPLTTETILTEGVVSKVTEDQIYSDVNINPGNSGGPLLDSGGRVVGINTFRLGAGEGSGLSGITRIHLARASLATAREKMKTEEPPAARSLPVESTYRFDPDATKAQVLAGDRKAKDYHLEAKKMSLMVITPALIASEILSSEREAAEARKKRRKDQNAEGPAESDAPSQRLYAWQMDEDNFRPVVRVRALPEFKLTLGSAFKMGMTGRGGKMRVKTDFERMELRRGENVVEPILPGRIKEVLDVEGPSASLKDIAYWGLYEYPPEAFKPGAPLVLRVWEQGVAEPQVIELPEDLLTRIREDFKPYLESSASAGR